MGLQVISRDRVAPGFSGALTRAAVFIILPNLAIYFAIGFLHVQGGFIFVLLAAFCWLVMFSTARTSNGLAGVHGLLSGTRVTVKPGPVSWKPEAVDSINVDTLKAHSTIGPYDVLSPVPDDAHPCTVLAHDPLLHRRVWLHVVEGDAPPRSAPRRLVNRTGRQHWLNG